MIGKVVSICLKRVLTAAELSAYSTLKDFRPEKLRKNSVEVNGTKRFQSLSLLSSAVQITMKNYAQMTVIFAAPIYIKRSE